MTSTNTNTTIYYYMKRGLERNIKLNRRLVTFNPGSRVIPEFFHLYNAEKLYLNIITKYKYKYKYKIYVTTFIIFV